MQAIVTKFIPATNFKGSRIKATCNRGSIILSYPSELNSSDVHPWAAQKLCEKFAAADLKEYGTPVAKNPWMRAFVSGGLPGDKGECHVFVD